MKKIVTMLFAFIGFSTQAGVINTNYDIAGSTPVFINEQDYFSSSFGTDITELFDELFGDQTPVSGDITIRYDYSFAIDDPRTDPNLGAALTTYRRIYAEHNGAYKEVFNIADRGYTVVDRDPKGAFFGYSDTLILDAATFFNDFAPVLMGTDHLQTDFGISFADEQNDQYSDFDGATGNMSFALNFSFEGEVTSPNTTSVSEPGSLAILAVGLFALARRKRNGQLKA
jgi:hypothetical protein